MPALVIVTAGILSYGALNYWAGRLRTPPESKYFDYAVKVRGLQRRIAPVCLMAGSVMAVTLVIWWPSSTCSDRPYVPLGSR